MEHKKPQKQASENTPQNKPWLEVFDVVFIMLLCFLILLSTMIMRGKVLVGAGSAGGINYSFNLPIFLMLMLILGIYLVYVISRSDKELKVMIRYLYDETRRNVG
ncbi:hypothetical protein REC12_07890 [Desulfosporosinus sp. PR]|uniref:hypothetical protein n=1 Tax=Candidatus Desulfosporosinus nitrosoreducens TaxID=3401928 RepID=UPI0027E6FC1F|nr:hypothetical protein [Desulfosporosinus sp. PR]MDQ7093507.1 hypothetical protein [Desulfosporosinus sp. PR]